MSGTALIQPLIAYEDLSNVDRQKAVRAADEVLRNGWARRKYPSIRLTEPIPWDLNKPEFRSWNFYIHCLDMVDSLLKAYVETADQKYLQPVVRIVLDWIGRHASTPSTEHSPMAWYDMSVGLRVYRMAYLLDAASRAGLLDEVQQETIWQSLEEHRVYLADDRHIVFHNNHGFYQVAGQLALGRRFAARSESMADALVQGRGRLLAMMRTQFTDEGVHREHSPDYHRMVYDTLKAMIDAGLVDDAETIALAERIERSLAWFVLPDQHIANFGDSDYRLMSRKPAEAERKWRTDEMRYAASRGLIGRPPDVESQTFSETGYYVVKRRSDRRPDDFGHWSYLAQIACFHSRVHKHADDLSLIWSDRGSNLLIDAGRYGYIGKALGGSELWKDGYWYDDPKRVYVESTRAHNTLEFDGRNAGRKGVKPYGSALRRTTHTFNGVFAAETEVRHHGSIRHARVLLFKPARWLVVFDWFHDNLGKPHDVCQWFHLAPDHTLLADRDGYLVPVDGSPEPLRIVELFGDAKASRPFLAEGGEPMQGWWSAAERELTPAYAFCFARAGLASGSFATLLSFSESLSARASRVNASGRKALLRWTDEAGDHQIDCERPQDGELVVAYNTTAGG
jgi:hypothetical protein